MLIFRKLVKAVNGLYRLSSPVTYTSEYRKNTFSSSQVILVFYPKMFHHICFNATEILFVFLHRLSSFFVIYNFPVTILHTAFAEFQSKMV